MRQWMTRSGRKTLETSKPWQAEVNLFLPPVSLLNSCRNSGSTSIDYLND